MSPGALTAHLHFRPTAITAGPNGGRLARTRGRASRGSRDASRSREHRARTDPAASRDDEQVLSKLVDGVRGRCPRRPCRSFASDCGAGRPRPPREWSAVEDVQHPSVEVAPAPAGMARSAGTTPGRIEGRPARGDAPRGAQEAVKRRGSPRACGDGPLETVVVPAGRRGVGGGPGVQVCGRVGQRPERSSAAPRGEAASIRFDAAGGQCRASERGRAPCQWEDARLAAIQAWALFCKVF